MITTIVAIVCLLTGWWLGKRLYLIRLDNFETRFNETNESIQIILKDDKYNPETKVKKIEYQMTYLSGLLKSVKRD